MRESTTHHLFPTRTVVVAFRAWPRWMAATAILLAVTAATAAQDWGERPAGPVAGGGAANANPVTRHFADAIAQREPASLPLPPAVRLNLVVTDSQLYYLKRLDPIPETPIHPPPIGNRNGADDNGNDDGNDDDDDEFGGGDGTHGMAVPKAGEKPAEWAIFRAPLDGTSETKIVDVGLYPFAFFVARSGVAGDTRIICVRQHEDTDGDGKITLADARSLWIGPDEPATATDENWRKLYHGSPYLTVAAVLARHSAALIVEPGPVPHANRILRVDFDADFRIPAQPFSEGIFVECVDPAERYVIVARRGRPQTASEGFGAPGPGIRMRALASRADAEMAILLPPDHVKVDWFDPRQESVVLAGEDWIRIAFVADGFAHAEVLVVPPIFTDKPLHPLRQSQHTLDAIDMATLTRVPITSEWQFDAQWIGALPGHGVIYAHNTHLSRRLRLFAERRFHLSLAELSPLSFELCLSPDRSRIVFFEFADAATPPYSPLTSPSIIRHLSLRPE